MMSKKEESYKFVLELTEKEARWLKELMQNPLHGEHTSVEPPEDREMRQLFWSALNK